MSLASSLGGHKAPMGKTFFQLLANFLIVGFELCASIGFLRSSAGLNQLCWDSMAADDSKEGGPDVFKLGKVLASGGTSQASPDTDREAQEFPGLCLEPGRESTREFLGLPEIGRAHV